MTAETSAVPSRDDIVRALLDTPLTGLYGLGGLVVLPEADPAPSNIIDFEAERERRKKD